MKQRIGPRELVVSEQAVIAVLLVLMLQQLAQLTKYLGTVWTIIREIGNIVRAASIRQHGNIVQIVLHLRLTGGKLVDLVPGVVNSSTPSAVATFDMLHSVGARLESLLSTDGTTHVTRTVDLLVHFKIVLVVKGPGAIRTRVDRPVDAVGASRSSCTFVPLVVAKIVRLSTIATLSAATLVHNLVDAVDASRSSPTFPPLVAAKVVRTTPLPAISTNTIHVTLLNRRSVLSVENQSNACSVASPFLLYS
jgi:hypothetical protein